MCRSLRNSMHGLAALGVYTPRSCPKKYRASATENGSRVPLRRMMFAMGHRRRVLEQTHRDEAGSVVAGSGLPRHCGKFIRQEEPEAGSTGANNNRVV